ncbi:MAG: hypothetical protein AAF549_01820 [Pseudomonadota bacterium]
MKEFNLSLLREKFTIIPKNETEDPLIATSNRIVLPLVSPDGIDNEEFIVRTQNMHSCCRMAASIIKEFTERGSVLHRAQPVDWKLMWHDVIKGYERKWNDDIWCVIYFKGRILFQSGKYHPFLDIIEQCDASNENNYQQSIKLAEDIFAKAGKQVIIKHDSNIALVLQTKPDIAKCGIIIRAASGTTTFNYTTKLRYSAQAKITAYTILTAAASFLEAVQLSFTIGLLKRKIDFGMIKRHSEDEQKFKKSETRLGNLNRAIKGYEEKYDVFYRPDKPDFFEMVTKANEFAGTFLKPEK